MAWNKNSEESFPARHPREPGGLRQDILDEIADHLACSAEREQNRDHAGTEETVWRRVLEKFGDPNSLARRLWWDQMRETVMREWIQTGVLALLAVVGIAGVVLVIMMMGRLSQTNDAMQTAMEQVAATNEALVKVLSGLPGGDTGADSLDLATIEIVVRRGSPEGPPAPEVAVILGGKGSNDQELKVDGQADTEGRTVFERLAQGRYELSFYDPVSELHLKEELTLFAGKGAGEYIFVAPDVAPRPVHIDWGLPEYGRDTEVLINCMVEASWNYESHTWYLGRRGLVGRKVTWLEPDYRKTVDDGGLVRRRTSSPSMAFPPADEWTLLEMAGDIHVSSVYILQTNSDGTWGMGNVTQKILDLTLLADDASRSVYQGVLPDDYFQEYSELARYDRGQDHVPDVGYHPWLHEITWRSPESIVVAAESVTDRRWATWKDGELSFLEEGRHKNSIETDPLTNSQWGLVVDLPELVVSEGALMLAIGNSGARQYLPEYVDGGTRIEERRHIGVATGNTLAAYALRESNAGSNAGPVIDTAPFWQLAIEDFEPRRSSGNVLLVPVPSDIGEGGSGAMTGVLLRWTENSREFIWGVRVETSGDTIEDRPCWVVTAPATSAAQSLDDIDGRVHHDALQGNEVR